MAWHVVFLWFWVFWLHSVVGQNYEGRYGKKTITHFPEVKDGKCVFPFRYRGGTFHDCVMFNSKHRWCSLNETYQGYWKYCSEEDFAKCMFPFWYRRLIYSECTDDGDLFGKKWCSLTRNYNKDKVWKYCD